MGDLLMNNIQMKQLEQTLTSMEVAEKSARGNGNLFDAVRYGIDQSQNVGMLR